MNEDLHLDVGRMRRALWGIPALSPSKNISEVCAVELVRDVDGGLLPVHNRFDGEAKQQNTARGRDDRAARNQGFSCRGRAALWHRAEHAAGNSISCASARKPSQRWWGRGKWSRRQTRSRRRHGGGRSTLFCLLKAAARDVDAVPCLSSGRENAPGGAATPHEQHACQQSHPSWHPAPPGRGSAREEPHAGLQGGCAAESTKGQRTREAGGRREKLSGEGRRGCHTSSQVVPRTWNWLGGCIGPGDSLVGEVDGLAAEVVSC